MSFGRGGGGGGLPDIDDFEWPAAKPPFVAHRVRGTREGAEWGWGRGGGARAAGRARPQGGGRRGDLAWAAKEDAGGLGFSVVRQYVGHGIGRDLHEEPAVPNYGTPGRGMLLQTGMVLAIEPMVNAGTWRTRVLDDDWTVVTEDGGLSAHAEHTVAITENGPEILTAR